MTKSHRTKQTAFPDTLTRRLGAVAAALALALGLPAAAQATETVVTALTGTVTADGQVLSTYAPIGDGSGPLEIQTDAGSGCALLHGEKLLVELGPGSSIVLEPQEGGATHIAIARGQLRLTTERKRRDPKVEVRTPSARIRPMTSIILVELDTETGQTRVTSIENRALVISADPQFKKSALLNSNQWVHVPTGGPPEAIQQADAESSALASSAAMSSLRAASLAHFGGQEGQSLLASISTADVPDGAPSSVAKPFVTPSGFAFSNEAPGRNDVGCDPLSCGLAVGVSDTRPGGPGVCTGLPGEQCQR